MQADAVVAFACCDWLARVIKTLAMVNVRAEASTNAGLTSMVMKTVFDGRILPFCSNDETWL